MSYQNLCVINGNLDIEKDEGAITLWKGQIDAFISKKRAAKNWYKMNAIMV